MSGPQSPPRLSARDGRRSPVAVQRWVDPSAADAVRLVESSASASWTSGSRAGSPTLYDGSASGGSLWLSSSTRGGRGGGLVEQRGRSSPHHGSPRDRRDGSDSDASPSFLQSSPSSARSRSVGSRRRSPSPRTLAQGRRPPAALLHSSGGGDRSPPRYRLGESVGGFADPGGDPEFSEALVGVREEWLALRSDLTLAGQREGAAVQWFVRKLQRERLRAAWSDWVAGVDQHTTAKATQELSARLSAVSAELYHTRAVHRLEASEGGGGDGDGARLAEILLQGAALPGGAVAAEFGAVACRLHRASAAWVGAPIAAATGGVEGLALRLAREEEDSTQPLRCAVAVMGVSLRKGGRCAERALAAQRRGARAVIFVDPSAGSRPRPIPVSWTVRCLRPVGVTRELEVGSGSLIIGSHVTDTLLEVFERCSTLGGQTRLRIVEGWISERSRDGKQLVEALDDEDADDDEGGILGPMGGVEALSLPVVSIGAAGKSCCCSINRRHVLLICSQSLLCCRGRAAAGCDGRPGGPKRVRGCEIDRAEAGAEVTGERRRDHPDVRVRERLAVAVRSHYAAEGGSQRQRWGGRAAEAPAIIMERAVLQVGAAVRAVAAEADEKGAHELGARGAFPGVEGVGLRAGEAAAHAAPGRRAAGARHSSTGIRALGGGDFISKNVCFSIE